MRMCRRPSLDSDGYIKPVPMQAYEDEGSDSQSQPRSEVLARVHLTQRGLMQQWQLLRALSGGANGGAASEFLKVKAKIDLLILSQMMIRGFRELVWISQRNAILEYRIIRRKQ